MSNRCQSVAAVAAFAGLSTSAAGKEERVAWYG